MATATAALGRVASPRLVMGYFLFLTVASLLLFSPRAAAQPWQLCGNTGNYTANSTYQSNLEILAKALSANASRSRNLFAEGSVGAVPYVVYALALCRGDTNATACGSCVATGFQDAQQLCPYKNDAAVVYDDCYLRFSNQDFIASTTDNGNDNIILMNTQSVSSPVQAFDAAVVMLLNATGDYAAANSSRFATGEEGFDASYPTIYGLTQCTPDMSSADCRSCLGSIISAMPGSLSGSKGGRIIGTRCNFRYEVYSFFSGAPSLRLPAASPPAPPPSPTAFNVTPTATPPGEISATDCQVFSFCSFLVLDGSFKSDFKTGGSSQQHDYTKKKKKHAHTQTTQIISPFLSTVAVALYFFSGRKKKCPLY
jgi:hypothetical protein